MDSQKQRAHAYARRFARNNNSRSLFEVRNQISLIGVVQASSALQLHPQNRRNEHREHLSNNGAVSDVGRAEPRFPVHDKPRDTVTEFFIGLLWPMHNCVLSVVAQTYYVHHVDARIVIFRIL